MGIPRLAMEATSKSFFIRYLEGGTGSPSRRRQGAEYDTASRVRRAGEWFSRSKLLTLITIE
jgi:hypothetical protein